MTFIAGILTVLVLINCVVLIFLVLIQLPKKDAGAGLAFGGGAADALFGAGSGNALTKITKWAAAIFFALALLLGLTEDKLHQSNLSEFKKGLEQPQSQSMAPAPAPATSQPATPSTETAPAMLPPATTPATGTNASAK